MKRTLLVDADIVAYKCAASNESIYYFDGKDQPPSVEHDTIASCSDAEEYVRDLKAQLGADRVVICLTDRGNEYRKDFWPDYKGNRKGRKPTDLMPVLDHLAATFETYKRPRLEADDCMGILSTHPSIIPGERIIVSEDKDMATIPGLLFNPAKDIEPRKVSQLAANRFHLAQTITGDQTDNYPGAAGIGPKSPEVEAVMASKSVEEMWRHVLAAYLRAALKAAKKSGKEPTDINMVAISTQAVIQARCARILRSSDWNFKDKRPILWVPPRIVSP